MRQKQVALVRLEASSRVQASLDQQHIVLPKRFNLYGPIHLYSVVRSLGQK